MQGLRRRLGGRADELDLDADRAHPAIRRCAGSAGRGGRCGRGARRCAMAPALDECDRANGPASHRVPPKGAIVQPGGRRRPRPPPGTRPAPWTCRGDLHLERAAWLAELRATLALSWPLVLTNVAQNALHDLRRHPDGLAGAAGAGGRRARHEPVFRLPDLRHRPDERHLAADRRGAAAATAIPSARSAARSARASGPRSTIALPIWIVAWNGERILLAIGQEPALAAAAGDYIRALQWSLLPFLFYLVLRSFLAALERPGWALLIGLLALPVNVGVGLCADVRRVRPAAPSASSARASPRRCRAPSCSWARLVVVSLGPQPAALSCSSGASGAPTGRATAALWRIGVPIGLTIAFEVTVFNAAALLMGRIGANELAAHAIALQIASFCFMVPFGVGQAVTVRVGRAFGAQDPDGVTRAGWTAFALGVGFMGFTALLMLFAPHLLIGVFLDLADPRERARDRLRRARSCCWPPCSSWPTAPRPSAPACCAGFRTPACPCSTRPSAIGASACRSASSSPSARPCAASASGSGSPPASPSSPWLMLWRWLRRDRLGLVLRGSG